MESHLAEYDRDCKKLDSLLEEYRIIIRRLDEAERQGMLTLYECGMIHDLLKHVSDHVSARYPNVRKGVDVIMGGNVIETRTSIAFAEAERREKQGEKRGEQKAYYQMVQDGDISISRAAQKLNLSEEQVRNNMLLLGYKLP